MSPEQDSEGFAKKLGSIGWGLFLAWLGILFIGGLSTAIGFLGLGAIVLGVQAVRVASGLPREGFWLFVGVLFVAAAVWEFLSPRLPLITVVLVLAGAAVIRAALKGS